MKKMKFDVFGMTCSSCQAHVEKAVNKLEGIKKVNVNLLSNNMVVEFDENKITEEVIIKSVLDAGYNAEVSLNNKKSKTPNGHDKKIDENILKMKKRLVWSFIFLIPLMYVAMYHMFNSMLGIPIPEIVTKLFDGIENALRLAITELILLIPIVVLNRNYFIVGFNSP